LLIAAVVAVVSAIGIVVLAVQIFSGNDDDARVPLAYEGRARAPFEGYRETRIEVDGRCRLVAVADSPTLRGDGLRDHVDLGAYAGMLFVFDHDTNASFTMAAVTQPLEIGWYTADGARVGTAHMAPCPDRAAADCPVYAPSRNYRLALERPGGSASPSALTSCS
jgi:uncharacterized membrane protein (UPF0127 family)